MRREGLFLFCRAEFEWEWGEILPEMDVLSVVFFFGLAPRARNPSLNTLSLYSYVRLGDAFEPLFFF